MRKILGLVVAFAAIISFTIGPPGVQADMMEKQIVTAAPSVATDPCATLMATAPNADAAAPAIDGKNFVTSFFRSQMTNTWTDPYLQTYLMGSHDPGGTDTPSRTTALKKWTDVGLLADRNMLAFALMALYSDGKQIGVKTGGLTTARSPNNAKAQPVMTSERFAVKLQDGKVTFLMTGGMGAAPPQVKAAVYDGSPIRATPPTLRQ